MIQYTVILVKKKSIHFQRNEVNKILNKRFNLLNSRLNHKAYLQKLKKF